MGVPEEASSDVADKSDDRRDMKKLDEQVHMHAFPLSIEPETSGPLPLEKLDGLLRRLGRVCAQRIGY
jgi:hypothetical protein